MVDGVLQLARFGADPLAYLERLRADERDVIGVRLGSQTVHLVTAPALIRAVLESEDWPPLARGRLATLGRWCPEGIPVTSGAEHHRQRDELWRPLAASQEIYGIAVERTRRRAAGWLEGRPLDMHRELRALCWGIDWEALTGTDLDAAPDLLAALELGLDALAWLVLPFGGARWDAPLPASRRTRAARARLDAVIALMIAARRERPGVYSDLLSLLVRTADAPGSATTDEQVRATFKIWFGTSLVHIVLTWALQFLARDTQVEATWRAELDRAGEISLEALPYTRAVVLETLRLVPPSWVIFRALEGDFGLDGRVIPAGDIIALSPWFTHRDPRHWPEPERFDPGRWGADPHPPAYFPFSAGPYGCHGPRLATTVAVLVLATLGRRWAFRPSGPLPRFRAAWAVEPRGGSRMKPVPRP
jgi:cytochrome P450